jgi:hypothetical protein
MSLIVERVFSQTFEATSDILMELLKSIYNKKLTLDAMKAQHKDLYDAWMSKSVKVDILCREYADKKRTHDETIILINGKRISNHSSITESGTGIEFRLGVYGVTTISSKCCNCDNIYDKGVHHVLYKGHIVSPLCPCLGDNYVRSIPSTSYDVMLKKGYGRIIPYTSLDKPGCLIAESKDDKNYVDEYHSLNIPYVWKELFELKDLPTMTSKEIRISLRPVTIMCTSSDEDESGEVITLPFFMCQRLNICHLSFIESDKDIVSIPFVETILLQYPSLNVTIDVVRGYFRFIYMCHLAAREVDEKYIDDLGELSFNDVVVYHLLSTMYGDESIIYFFNVCITRLVIETKVSEEDFQLVEKMFPQYFSSMNRRWDLIKMIDAAK